MLFVRPSKDTSNRGPRVDYKTHGELKASFLVSRLWAECSPKWVIRTSKHKTLLKLWGKWVFSFLPISLEWSTQRDLSCLCYLIIIQDSERSKREVELRKTQTHQLLLKKMFPENTCLMISVQTSGDCSLGGVSKQTFHWIDTFTPWIKVCYTRKGERTGHGQAVSGFLCACLGWIFYAYCREQGIFHTQIEWVTYYRVYKLD